MAHFVLKTLSDGSPGLYDPEEVVQVGGTEMPARVAVQQGILNSKFLRSSGWSDGSPVDSFQASTKHSPGVRPAATLGANGQSSMNGIGRYRSR